VVANPNKQISFLLLFIKNKKMLVFYLHLHYLHLILKKKP